MSSTTEKNPLNLVLFLLFPLSASKGGFGKNGLKGVVSVGC